MTGFVDDLHRAARALRRAPAFTIACAATLGIAIGAATAIFSVADPMIIRPLPYQSPERAVTVYETDADGSRSNIGFATYADVAAASRSFQHLAAVGTWQPTLLRNDGAEQLTGLRVSWSYFRALGVAPVLGTDFESTSDNQAGNGVVILSHRLWRSRFAADSSLVGGFIDLDGRQMRVAGVMGASYDDVLQPGSDIWRVLGYEPTLGYACRTCRHLRMVGRLKSGVTSEAARAELATIATRLVRENPRDYPAAGFQVFGLQDDATRAVRPALIALLSAVVLLLIIATANVSGLQFARALQRDQEFAVRAALGAGTGRLTRQLVAEGLVLSVVALAVGLVVARVGLAELVAQLPATLPRLDAVRLDLRALGLAGIVTLAAGLSVGLIPAWHTRRRALITSLRGGRRLGRTPTRVRGALVVAEVAVSALLLVGAGLLTRSFVALIDVNPGFDPAHVATTQVSVSGPRFATDTATYVWHDRLIDAVRALPGVERVALASQLPLSGSFDSNGILAEDKPLANPELAPGADRYAVSTDFLRTMRIPVTEGRDFDANDNALSAAPVALVSQSLARRIWGEESPIGKRIHMGEATRPWFTVVGVAGDVHHRALNNDATMQVYVPTRRWFFADNPVDVVVRTGGDPGAALTSLRRAVLGVEPASVVTRLATMEQVHARSTAQQTLAMTLFITFAGIALALAAAGIFGALAGSVAERRREIGLRSALGASPGEILRLVLRQGLSLAAGGAAIGLVLALAGSRFIESLLFGIGGRDVVTLSAVAIAVGVAALGASLIPAWRAVRVDPITALRSD